jgi:hypothetical protein
MNTTDLREALVELAQPEDRLTAAPLAAVQQRVRRRRVAGGVMLAGALAIAIVGAVSVARVDDGNGTRVEATATTIHDQQHGFSVVLPPGWKREATPGRQVLAVGFEHEEHPEVTRRQFEDLQPLQAQRRRLEAELRQAPSPSDAARIRSQLETLAQDETEIRTRTDDLESLQRTRSAIVEQLRDPSVVGFDRELLQSQDDALTQAEAVMRSRIAGSCRPQVTTGISIALAEGPYEMPGAPPLEPRPGAFGPDDGNGSVGDPNWPACSPRRQTIRFADSGRELTVVLAVAPGVADERVDEAYGILDSLRFTAEPPPSG